MTPSQIKFQPLTVAILGATGLIGENLLSVLIRDDSYLKIKVIGRNPVVFNHPKIESSTINFQNREAFKNVLNGSDMIFCCTGTTLKRVRGNMEEYRRVDYDIPVTAAEIGEEIKCSAFLLVSSVGANSKSNNFYLKIKGEVEDNIKSKAIPSVYFFRPSVLLGDRNEFRTGELIGKKLMSAASFLLPDNYKPIHAKEVAQAMACAGREKLPGIHVLHYNEIKNRQNQS